MGIGPNCVGTYPSAIARQVSRRLSAGLLAAMALSLVGCTQTARLSRFRKWVERDYTGECLIMMVLDSETENQLWTSSYHDSFSLVMFKTLAGRLHSRLRYFLPPEYLEPCVIVRNRDGDDPSAILLFRVEAGAYAFKEFHAYAPRIETGNAMYTSFRRFPLSFRSALEGGRLYVITLTDMGVREESGTDEQGDYVKKSRIFTHDHNPSLAIQGWTSLDSVFRFLTPFLVELRQTVEFDSVWAQRMFNEHRGQIQCIGAPLKRSLETTGITAGSGIYHVLATQGRGKAFAMMASLWGIGSPLAENRVPVAEPIPKIVVEGDRESMENQGENRWFGSGY